jgi:PAS domain-containing protein
MIYQDKSKEELIIGLKEIQLKNTVLQALCETNNATHKLALDALNASEIRYRRLFESAKDGILILDAKTGLIKDVNPFLIELLGYSKDEFLDKAIWEIGFFRGTTTILIKTGINLLTGASINGRLLAQTAVALQKSTVVKP